MRILYHHRTLAEDAQGVHIEEMIRAFRARGHTVREASLVRRGDAGVEPGPSPWHAVARLARGPVYELLEYLYNGPATARLVREIREFRPHLVYERYALSTLAGVFAARRCGVPHFLEINAPLVDEKRRWGRLWLPGVAARVEGRIFRATDRAIVVSSVLARTVEAKGVARDRIRVLRNGVDPARFHPGVRGDEVRSRFRLEDRIVVGFVGWFREWHGLSGVVEAMGSPSLRSLPLHLLLVGDGPARAGIETTAHRLGMADRVTVTGPVGRAELPSFVASFDLALQPAATEYSCPMKIPEYLALGKPVVAPDQDNIRELVRDGSEGLLFPPGDASGLTRAIRSLAEDRDRRGALGEGAARRVREEHWTWEANAERVEGMLRELKGVEA